MNSFLPCSRAVDECRPSLLASLHLSNDARRCRSLRRRAQRLLPPTPPLALSVSSSAYIHDVTVLLISPSQMAFVADCHARYAFMSFSIPFVRSVFSLPSDKDPLPHDFFFLLSSIGVTIVGLAGSMIKDTVKETALAVGHAISQPLLGLARRAADLPAPEPIEEPEATTVLLGVFFTLFAQFLSVNSSRVSAHLRKSNSVMLQHRNSICRGRKDHEPVLGGASHRSRLRGSLRGVNNLHLHARARPIQRPLFLL